MKRKRRSKLRVPSVSEEFDSAQLGDIRRVKRLQEIACDLSKAPDRSFPEQMGSEAALEGLYRFLGSEEVTDEAILAAHAEETALRVEEVHEALCIHDTSEYEFSGDVVRDGLGRLGRRRQGFLFHPSLAVAADSFRPLGVLAAKAWVRPWRTRNPDSERTKESARWLEGVRAAEERVGDRGQLIHVMDREGDIYGLYAELTERGKKRFVIRLAQDRRVLSDELGTDPVKLREALEGEHEVLTLEVPLSPRKADPRPGRSKSLPPRDWRMATLTFSAKRLTFLRPKNERASSPLPASIDVNVVHVREVNAPEGEEPVEWLLVTTEPIATREDVVKIVNWYRARWLIEEFFKATKTGCEFEERQLESYDTLLKALMIFIPIATQMLLLRHLERTDPDAPASAALSASQIAVLRAHKRTRLRANASVRDALRAVAALGGFIKNNKRPGWLVLSRGMNKLVAMVAGWELAHLEDLDPERCDRC